MNKKIVYVFLLFLIAAISLSPRFSLGSLSVGRNIDIRVEDLLISGGLLACASSFLSGRYYKFKTPPLFWQIAIWLGFGFFSILVNLLINEGNLSLPFFYFLKEIEFFVLYFFVFYLIDGFNLSNKKIISWWIFFSIINIIWLAYVFIFDVRWSIFYGPNIFMEPQGPFPSGGFFLLLFIFFFNIFIFYYSKLPISNARKVIFLLLSALSIVGVVSSGSMASALGLAVSILASLFLFWLGGKNVVRSIKIVVLGSVIVGVFFLALSVISVWKIVSIKKIVYEYESGDKESRLGILRENASTIINNVPNMLIGFGVRGEAHSQYMRVILERGAIGFFLFTWLIFSILKISYTGFTSSSDNFTRSLSAGLFVATISMLAMAVPNDVFMVVKVDEVYWFFTAMTMAAIYASPAKNNP